MSAVAPIPQGIETCADLITVDVLPVSLVSMLDMLETKTRVGYPAFSGRLVRTPIHSGV